MSITKNDTYETARCFSSPSDGSRENDNPSFSRFPPPSTVFLIQNIETSKKRGGRKKGRDAEEEKREWVGKEKKTGCEIQRYNFRCGYGYVVGGICGFPKPEGFARKANLFVDRIKVARSGHAFRFSSAEPKSSGLWATRPSTVCTWSSLCSFPCLFPYLLLRTLWPYLSLVLYLRIPGDLLFVSNPISSYDIDKKMNGIPVTRTSRSLRRKTCREEWQGRQDIGIVGDRNRSRGQAIRKTVEWFVAWESSEVRQMLKAFTRMGRD